MATRVRGRWVWWLVAVACALVMGLAGGFALGRSTVAPVAPTTPASAPPIAVPAGPDADADALAHLAALEVVDGWSVERYARAQFGDPWVDVDRNGCRTRDDILARDLLDLVVDDGGCRVLSGTLIDPYDGTPVDFVFGPDTSPAVQIDHVVALAWAWRHGAEEWTFEQRVAFANDPRNLVASSEATNQAKRDFGPGDWLPDDPELRCGFVETWVEVLAVYDLGINGDDKAAADAVLRTC